MLVKDGPLAGLTARAVFVVGADGKVKHAEYVREITTEPNSDAALNATRPAAGALAGRKYSPILTKERSLSKLGDAVGL